MQLAYIIAFFVVFTLLIAESIYFLKKRNGSYTQEGEQQGGSILKFGLPIIFIVAVGFGLYLFFTRKSSAPSQPLSVSQPSPTSILTATPFSSPTPFEIAKSQIAPTQSPSPTVPPTKTPIPTKTPKPSKTPTPPKVTKTPTPTISRIGSNEKIDETIIVPKLPQAGSTTQTVIYLITGLVTLALGLIL